MSERGVGMNTMTRVTQGWRAGRRKKDERNKEKEEERAKEKENVLPGHRWGCLVLGFVRSNEIKPILNQ